MTYIMSILAALHVLCLAHDGTCTEGSCQVPSRSEPQEQNLSNRTEASRCTWTSVVTGSIKGHNLAKVGNGYTIESCKVRCEANPACKSIDFRPRDGSCALGDCQIGDGTCENDNDHKYQYSSCVQAKMLNMQQQGNDEEVSIVTQILGSETTNKSRRWLMGLIVCLILPIFAFLPVWVSSARQKEQQLTTRDIPVEDSQDKARGIAVQENAKLKISREPAATWCCAAGISVLARNPRRWKEMEKHSKSRRLQALTRTETVPKNRGRHRSTSSSEHIRCSLNLASDGHPDLSGTFKCTSVDGNVDGFLADLGVSYLVRKAVRAWGCGAGKTVRIYEHTGMHVKIIERGAEVQVQEFDIIGEDQVLQPTTDPFVQKAYWDDADPHVLVLEGKDADLQDPSSWTVTKHIWHDRDTFVLEATSSGGYVAKWTYKRCVE